jgi:hypothetical protein
VISPRKKLPTALPYASLRCADRRDVEGQMSLFTADTEFLVYMDSRNPVPTQEICGRDNLRLRV